MMDHLTFSLAGEPRDFDGLSFNFVAKMQMPPGFDTTERPVLTCLLTDEDSARHHIRVPDGQDGLPVTVAGRTHLGPADVYEPSLTTA